MPSAIPRFQFRIQSLFTAVTIVALHLGVYSWSEECFFLVLPGSSCLIGMALIRRYTRARWPTAVAFGVALGTCTLSLVLGTLSFATAYFDQPPRGRWVALGLLTFTEPALHGAVQGLLNSGCVALISGLGIALDWFLATRPDKYYIIHEHARKAARNKKSNRTRRTVREIAGLAPVHIKMPGDL